MATHITSSIKSLLVENAVSKRNFRYLWFSQIFSQIATNTMVFVLALNLYHLTGSNTAVSGLFMVYGIPAVIFGMIAGAIVDKLENKKILLVCDATRFVIAILLIFTYKNIFFIYILTFLNSIINQFYIPSEAPTIPFLVPKRLVISANSLFSFTYYSSLAIGSVLAGPLLRLFEPNQVFILIAILFLIAFYNVTKLPAFIDDPIPFKRIFHMSFEYIITRLVVNIKEGIKYVGKSVVLKDALILLTGTQIILALLATLGPGFADKVMEIDFRDSSLLITGPTVLGIVLGALWVGSNTSRFSTSKMTRYGIVSAGIILMAVAVIVRLSRVPLFSWIFANNVVLAVSVILFFFLGVANSLLDVPSNANLQKEASGNMRGRVYGMLTSAVGGIGILPIVASGILADKIGVGKVIFILGFFITMYSYFRSRNKLL
ncbi:MFS transporter [Patescibacteria group bacterium]